MNENLILELHSVGAIQFGKFKLKSGMLSPFYLDLRILVSHPGIMRDAARAFAQTLNTLRFDRIAAIPYAALPIATALALEMDRPLIYPRREVKDYGTQAAIEGPFQAGETALAELMPRFDTFLELIPNLPHESVPVGNDETGNAASQGIQDHHLCCAQGLGRQGAQGAHLPQVRGSGGQMSRLKDRYVKDVVPSLRKEFGYRNVMAVPRIEKIVVNVGVPLASRTGASFTSVTVTVKLTFAEESAGVPPSVTLTVTTPPP